MAPPTRATCRGACRLRERVEAGDWDGVKAALDSFSFPRLKALRGFSNDPLKERVQGRTQAGKRADRNTGGKSSSAQPGPSSGRISTTCCPKSTRLFEVTLAFDRRFTRKSGKASWWILSDLEHLALALLWEKEEGGYHPTALAKQASQRFEEVFVDEYQDTNEAQDMPSGRFPGREEKPLLVGMWKQSIYRFRQAMPEIFLEKKRHFAPYDGEHYPAKILLGRNFRSQ